MKSMSTQSSDLKEHVFLIEDDITLSASICSSLEYLNYCVHKFTCAEDFLISNISSFSPAVILSDVALPGYSGIELQSKLVALEHSIPIIFISGECSAAESAQGIKQGAVEFLAKPFRRDDLLNAISWGIQLHRNYLKHTEFKAAATEILNRLAPREREVFNHLVSGCTNQQMSVGLNLSLETIKQYKKQIKQKLEVSDLSDLIALSKVVSNKRSA